MVLSMSVLLKYSIPNSVLCSPLDVCMLRLDFETFSLDGTGGSNGLLEGTCLDQFTATVSWLLLAFT